MKITVGGKSKYLKEIGKPEIFKTLVNEKILVFGLSGCARDRRKQLRAIERKYAGCRIEKCAVSLIPGSVRRKHPALYEEESFFKVEEANKPQTLVRVWVPDSSDFSFSHIDELDRLQSLKNQGRGISCVRTIIHYLRRGQIDLAKNVYEVDGDKICAVYPDVDKMICQGLKIKPRYSNPGWSE